MRDINKFEVKFGDETHFLCERDKDSGNFVCTGTVNGVDYVIRVPNAAPTRVFQVLTVIAEARP